MPDFKIRFRERKNGRKERCQISSYFIVSVLFGRRILEEPIRVVLTSRLKGGGGPQDRPRRVTRVFRVHRKEKGSLPEVVICRAHDGADDSTDAAHKNTNSFCPSVGLAALSSTHDRTCCNETSPNPKRECDFYSAGSKSCSKQQRSRGGGTC